MSGVFLIGGNHWDERWVASHPLLSGESVLVSTTRQPGGAVANMARALGSAGVVTQVASVYGFVAQNRLEAKLPLGQFGSRSRAA